MGNQLELRKERFLTLRGTLETNLAQIKAALPKHMTANRMVRIALTATSKNPKLLECTPQSVCLALLNCSELGLEPNGREAHLIPYMNNKTKKLEAQFQPDYKGLVQLAYRSGQVLDFHAAAVYEKDQFEFSYGTDGFLKHIPTNEDPPGKLTYAYAVAKLVNGGTKFVVLNERQVNHIRKSSRASSSGPWVDHPEAMWAKTAAKQLCKWIPLSAELSRAVKLDDDAECGNVQSVELVNLNDSPPISDEEVQQALESEPLKQIEATKNVTRSPLNDTLAAVPIRDRLLNQFSKLPALTRETKVILGRLGISTAGQLMDMVQRDEQSGIGTDDWDVICGFAADLAMQAEQQGG